MTKKTTAHLWLPAQCALVLPLAVAGCLADSGGEDESREDLETSAHNPHEEFEAETEIETVELELESFRSGRTRGDYPGAVWLKAIAPQLAIGTPIQWVGCSGAVIAPDLIMTAAHCLDTYPDGSPLANGAIVQMAIEGRVNGARRCITDFFGADSTCLTESELNDLAAVRDDMARVQIFRNTAFREWDAATDVAVVKLLQTNEFDNYQISDERKYSHAYWAGYGPDDECSEAARQGKTPCYMRIMTRPPAAGSWFEWNGWGDTRDGAGDAGSALNWGLTKADWVRSGHFGRDTAASDQERACKGDSGGPAVVHNSAWGISGSRTFLIGVFSGFNDLEGTCADPGDLERWARADVHTWLITNSASDSRPGAGRSCEASSVNSHSYLKCWDVDYYLR